jgi:hypothetical protein
MSFKLCLRYCQMAALLLGTQKYPAYFVGSSAIDCGDLCSFRNIALFIIKNHFYAYNSVIQAYIKCWCWY